jgi:hypothetical protein
MKTNTRCALQRLALGWALFLTGWLLILWLHSFNDQVTHRLMGPLLLLLWITLTVCLWDGCRILPVRLRAFLFLAQVATGVGVSTLIVLHLLNHAA